MSEWQRFKGLTQPVVYKRGRDAEREVNSRFTRDFVFPGFKHCLLNYLCLIFVESATLDGSETPVFYLYMKKDAGMVMLSILEAVLLMCFRPKSHYLIPLIEPRNQGGAYSSTETSPCYDSGAEYLSAEMVQPSPAAFINRKPSISARHLAFLSPPFLLFVGKFIYRGLPKPQCSKVPQIEGKQCSVGIIQTA